MFTKSLKRAICVIAVCVCALSVLLPAATAVPKTPSFGPMIDPYGGYEGQTRCSPRAKPGVLAFRDLILRAYPRTGPGSISRACNYGGQSEHKEGRAWDWGVRVSVPSEKAAANEVIAWLAGPDRYGNRRALARRFGIMYLIWNRRIWFPSSGWQTYCVQRKRGCVDPDDGDIRHPHTDHVHFSFTWAGAKKKTTYWNRDRSMVADIATDGDGSGFWRAGGNGAVLTTTSGYYGSIESTFPRKRIVAIAATPTGDGYWLATSAGRVHTFGDAVARGGTQDRSFRIVDMVSTPTGRGYWLVTTKGRVFDFGDAGHYGDARTEGQQIVAMAASSTGDGYWLFAATGRVFEFGDAEHVGDASQKDLTSIVGGGAVGTSGYWLVTRRGRVFDYGDAPSLSGVQGDAFEGRIVSLAPTPDGTGFVVASSMGDVIER
jgi:hypothetical protein